VDRATKKLSGDEYGMVYPSPGTTGKMTICMIEAIAEFERDLLERTQSDLAKAKSQGKTLSRPWSRGKATIKGVMTGWQKLRQLEPWRGNMTQIDSRRCEFARA